MNPQTDEPSDRGLDAPDPLVYRDEKVSEQTSDKLKAKPSSEFLAGLLSILTIAGCVVWSVWLWSHPGALQPSNNQNAPTTFAESLRNDTSTSPIQNDENRQTIGNFSVHSVRLSRRDRVTEREWSEFVREYPKRVDQSADIGSFDESSASRPEKTSSAASEIKSGHALPSDPKPHAAIEKSAFYFNGTKAKTFTPESVVGFRHADYGIETRVWDSFSSTQKLDMIYLSAERAVPGSGEVVMARLAKALAQEYDGAKYDPALEPYLELESSLKNKELRFEAPTPPISKTNLPVKDISKIEALDKYLHGPQFHGPSDVMQRYFPLTETEAAERLVAEGSLSKAIESQLSSFGPKGRECWFQLITQDVSDKYAAVLSEPSLQAEAALVLEARQIQKALGYPQKVHFPGPLNSKSGPSATKRPIPPQSRPLPVPPKPPVNSWGWLKWLKKIRL